LPHEQTKEAEFTVALKTYVFGFKAFTGIRRKCREDSENAGLEYN